MCHFDADSMYFTLAHLSHLAPLLHMATLVVLAITLAKYLSSCNQTATVPKYKAGGSFCYD